MVLNRGEQLAKQLQEAEIDALVCALPKNVLLLSGYWPVVGTGIAVAAANGDVHLIVPEDEKKFAESSCASTIETFSPASLDRITTPGVSIIEPLSRVLSLFGAVGLRVGYEHGEDSEPSSYAAMHLFQGALRDAIRQAAPASTDIAADALLRNLRAIKTENEIAGIQTACHIAEQGFSKAAAALQPGVTEIEAAAELRKQFASALVTFPHVKRAEAFVFVMSGQNSAQAHGAFAHSSTKRIESGDLVLVHCNSFADGYCTDITRTFSLGDVDDQRQKMYDAIFAAREAAFAAVRPGVKAADVDHAARNVLRERGFGPEFKHSTGHGVGFGAISPNALPRLHPKSDDVLREGMVFNVEPAIYVDGYGGIRHCDMVAITESGFKLLTPFQTSRGSVVLEPAGKAVSA